MARLKATDVVGKSSGAGIKVSSVTNYIPNTTTSLSGGVIASAKGMIPDINKVGYPMCCNRFHQMISEIIPLSSGRGHLLAIPTRVFQLLSLVLCGHQVLDTLSLALF